MRAAKVCALKTSPQCSHVLSSCMIIRLKSANDRRPSRTSSFRSLTRVAGSGALSLQLCPPLQMAVLAGLLALLALMTALVPTQQNQEGGLFSFRSLGGGSCQTSPSDRTFFCLFPCNAVAERTRAVSSLLRRALTPCK